MKILANRRLAKRWFRTITVDPIQNIFKATTMDFKLWSKNLNEIHQHVNKKWNELKKNEIIFKIINNFQWKGSCV